MTLQTGAAETAVDEALSNDAPAETTEATDNAKDADTGAKDDSSKQQEKPAEAEGAPDAYEAFNTELPDGVTLPEGLTDTISETAKALNLPQGKAQQLADLATSIVKNMHENLAAQIAAQKDAWAGEIKADKDVGGDKLAETMGLVKQATDKFFPKGFAEALSKSGLGNHPDFIRGMHKLAALVKDDDVVTGGNGPARMNTDTISLLKAL